ncbi:DNA cytosine methyltransferase [Kocuria sp. CPCC 205300]|uniref:DNA cytosine methyltransferase n=1 Tax=Kocuria sabuli TaxID=3071448 RepID=UPI0036D8F9E4
MPSTFIDLFSGAGGLSHGLATAGLDCLLASDYWRDALTTYNHNFPSHKTLLKDIRELDAREILDLSGEKPDWIVGGPPCQGYSTIGKRNRDDPRNVLFLEFRRIVKDINPAGFVIENVLGLKDMSFQKEVAESFENLGYQVSFMTLKAADYGVPQLRRRVVFVGHKSRGVFDMPTPTHAPDAYITVADAIFDLPPLEAGEEATSYLGNPLTNYQKMMREGSSTLQGHQVSKHPAKLVEAISHIPDGGNRQSIPPHLQPRSGYHNSYSRLASRLPAVAITQNLGKPSGTRSIHPTQDRGLTTREGARLQSFPDTFHFLGGVTSQRLQVGNAVPPVLARALGEALEDEANWGRSEVREFLKQELVYL